jgi:hypothetical protein
MYLGSAIPSLIESFSPILRLLFPFDGRVRRRKVSGIVSKENNAAPEKGDCRAKNENNVIAESFALISGLCRFLCT